MSENMDASLEDSIVESNPQGEASATALGAQSKPFVYIFPGEIVLIVKYVI